MRFSTPVPVEAREPKIDHHSRVFLLGSCFVENIGDKMDYYKFQNFRNPFGILYHPSAMEKFLTRVSNNFTYTAKDVFLHQERWHSFDAHSNLSDPVREELLRRLNENQEKTHRYLQQASHVILTLGTSWVYRNRESSELVANCHKLPQQVFSKEITGPQEIQSMLNSVVSLLTALNPEVKVIFTISPVRHVKEGLVANQQSKSHLIAATHTVIAENSESTFYFPAYEILLDELRDYRFFAEDMLHPNAVAIQFIWEQFTKAWLSPEAEKIMQKIEVIQKGLSHRPFHEQSQAHTNFLQSLHLKMDALKQQFPHLTFTV